MRFATWFFVAVFAALHSFSQAIVADSVYIKKNYTKWERMIPMRDGVKLFTSIYIPKDVSTLHPILLNRTPYSVAPYGEENFRMLWQTNHGLYAMKNYIIVLQDVRGRYMSEGVFMDVRPHNPNKIGNQTDESSDTYDTVEWLLQQLPNHNGHVGVFGISYPGFYSTMAALSGHPAIKAVSPQAPVTDWFMGDDFHHNGAFMLFDAFEFYRDFGVPRPLSTVQYNAGYQRTQRDAYTFFLQSGALPNYNKKYLGDSIAFWNDLMTQPVYNDWWKMRNTRNFVRDIKPAMLVVGGTFDAEDVFGAWNLYKAIEAQNDSTHFNKIVMGPWFHGAWGGRSTGDSLGDIKFGSATSLWYQQHIELPFFEHFLNNKATASFSEATVFFSGENQWRFLDKWPSKNVQETALYLHPKGKLSFKKPLPLKAKQKPENAMSFTHFISHPQHPVPHEGSDTITYRTREYMTNDQRFASARKDVLTFKSNTLTENITLAGPIFADLMVSTNTTDIDLVVKIIDELPDNVSRQPTGADTVYRNQQKMNGYQMLVRGEVMRGKFRNSFEEPEPFVPNKITQVKFYLPDVAHTFLKGHKMIIQIQASWFPLVDMNPQTFTDIYKAKDADFQPAEIKVFHADGIASKIILPVLKNQQ